MSIFGTVLAFCPLPMYLEYDTICQTFSIALCNFRSIPIPNHCRPCYLNEEATRLNLICRTSQDWWSWADVLRAQVTWADMVRTQLPREDRNKIVSKIPGGSGKYSQVPTVLFRLCTVVLNRNT